MSDFQKAADAIRAESVRKRTYMSQLIRQEEQQNKLRMQKEADEQARVIDAELRVQKLESNESISNIRRSIAELAEIPQRLNLERLNAAEAHKKLRAERKENLAALLKR